MDKLRKTDAMRELLAASGFIFGMSSITKPNVLIAVAGLMILAALEDGFMPAFPPAVSQLYNNLGTALERQGYLSGA